MTEQDVKKIKELTNEELVNNMNIVLNDIVNRLHELEDTMIHHKHCGDVVYRKMGWWIMLEKIWKCDVCLITLVKSELNEKEEAKYFITTNWGLDDRRKKCLCQECKEKLDKVLLEGKRGVMSNVTRSFNQIFS